MNLSLSGELSWTFELGAVLLDSGGGGGGGGWNCKKYFPKNHLYGPRL